MATTFINAISRAVGTTEIITFTATEKSIIIGGNITNLLGTALPVFIKLRRGSDDTYILKNKMIEPGEGFELSKGNKLVLAVGDKLVVSSSAATSIDVIFSILQGVS